MKAALKGLTIFNIMLSSNKKKCDSENWLELKLNSFSATVILGKATVTAVREIIKAMQIMVKYFLFTEF